ncbi:hypothetical protein E5Q_04832 [Mixia osmundae IAM 14324]|uniref:Uncharacterized protein n=1 Tax=Mixia osmundae (strain CBS 9802 / IAM 14324 / JCM 22182 / KY 12970) TaxID=764103 RepID=G7E5N9_MIXOS|nr:hypothetical protein E5Q_04832 [Mixia osmundae IAM 14324]
MDYIDDSQELPPALEPKEQLASAANGASKDVKTVNHLANASSDDDEFGFDELVLDEASLAQLDALTQSYDSRSTKTDIAPSLQSIERSHSTSKPDRLAVPAARPALREVTKLNGVIPPPKRARRDLVSDAHGRLDDEDEEEDNTMDDIVVLNERGDYGIAPRASQMPAQSHANGKRAPALAATKSTTAFASKPFIPPPRQTPAVPSSSVNRSFGRSISMSGVPTSTARADMPSRVNGVASNGAVQPQRSVSPRPAVNAPSIASAHTVELARLRSQLETERNARLLAEQLALTKEGEADYIRRSMEKKDKQHEADRQAHRRQLEELEGQKKAAESKARREVETARTEAAFAAQEAESMNRRATLHSPRKRAAYLNSVDRYSTARRHPRGEESQLMAPPPPLRYSPTKSQAKRPGLAGLRAVPPEPPTIKSKGKQGSVTRMRGFENSFIDSPSLAAASKQRTRQRDESVTPRPDRRQSVMPDADTPFLSRGRPPDSELPKIEAAPAAPEPATPPSSQHSMMMIDTSVTQESPQEALTRRCAHLREDILSALLTHRLMGSTEVSDSARTYRFIISPTFGEASPADQLAYLNLAQSIFTQFARSSDMLFRDCPPDIAIRNLVSELASTTVKMVTILYETRSYSSLQHLIEWMTYLIVRFPHQFGPAYLHAAPYDSLEQSTAFLASLATMISHLQPEVEELSSLGRTLLCCLEALTSVNAEGATAAFDAFLASKKAMPVLLQRYTDDSSIRALAMLKTLALEPALFRQLLAQPMHITRDDSSEIKSQIPLVDWLGTLLRRGRDIGHAVNLDAASEATTILHILSHAHKDSIVMLSQSRILLASLVIRIDADVDMLFDQGFLFAPDSSESVSGLLDRVLNCTQLLARLALHASASRDLSTVLKEAIVNFGFKGVDHKFTKSMGRLSYGTLAFDISPEDDEVLWEISELARELLDAIFSPDESGQLYDALQLVEQPARADDSETDTEAEEEEEVHMRSKAGSAVKTRSPRDQRGPIVIEDD